jgi:3',5'-cyclic-AMP phosphodiesterase
MNRTNSISLIGQMRRMMPIQLPRLTRRGFLRTTAAAGAAAAFPRMLWADDVKADPHVWALLSDTHVAGDAKMRWMNATMAENMSHVCNAVLASSTRHAGLLVTGDLAFDDGQDVDYTTFLSLVQPVRKAETPVHLLLGNHDHRRRFWQAIRKTDKSFKQGSAENQNDQTIIDRHLALVEADRANFVLLDSLDETDKAPGKLGDAQLRWLRDTLDSHRDKPAVVVVHHNPNPAGSRLGANLGGIGDSEALFEILGLHKQVKCLVFGHSHKWGISRRDEIHLVNLPPVGYVFDAKAPNGWVELRLKESGAELQLFALDEKHPEHRREVRLEWRAG